MFLYVISSLRISAYLVKISHISPLVDMVKFLFFFVSTEPCEVLWWNFHHFCWCFFFCGYTLPCVNVPCKAFAILFKAFCNFHCDMVLHVTFREFFVVLVTVKYLQCLFSFCSFCVISLPSEFSQFYCSFCCVYPTS